MSKEYKKRHYKLHGGSTKVSPLPNYQ